MDCVPAEKHTSDCIHAARELDRTLEIASYLCPVRRISFDGFVNYEGRRFGVPYWYSEHECRVKREGNAVYLYDLGLTRILTSHPVTWSTRDSFCRDQYLDAQPEELPSVPVRSILRQTAPPRLANGFSKFNFDKEDDGDA